MNRQRKVLITITYNEMGTIIDTKAEEVTQPVEPKTDLVNRSDVLELAKSGVLISNDNYEKVCKAINGLPSCHTCRECEPVEPKPVCEDAISRQDTVNALCQKCGLEHKCGGADCNENWCPDVRVVMNMPPVETKRLPQPHKCVVYRDGGECRYPIEACSECPKHEGMRALKSERPKGEWIFNPKDAIDSMFAKPKCNKCGFESADGGNFCPNCGADMKGADDETD